MAEQSMLMSAANIALSIGVIGTAICRLNAMTRHTLPGVRAQFALLVLGGAANLLQTIGGSTPPGIGNVALSAVLLAFLLLSSRRWADGAPPDTTMPAPLDALADHPR